MKRLLLFLALAGTIFAAGPVASTVTTPAVPDSVHAARPSRSAPRPSRSDKSPGRAVLYSALFPGGGQLYTQNYLKAIVIGGAQATLEYFALRDHLRAMDYQAKGDTVNYFRSRDSRNNFLWWTATVWVFSLADAYVSANMFHFKEDEHLGLFVSPAEIGFLVKW